MVKTDFVEGLKLYITVKGNIDPFLWHNSGPHGSRFKRNIWSVLTTLGFPPVACRVIVGVKSNYSSNYLEKARYNDVIYNHLKHLITEFSDAFALAEMNADLFTDPGRFINTKTPPYLLNHFRLGELNKVFIPEYSVYKTHPWVLKYIENPLGYLKGEWSEDPIHPAMQPRQLPSEGLVQYVNLASGVSATANVPPPVLEQTPAIPGAW